MEDKWKKKVEEICNTLEQQAEEECVKKINNADAYKNGYIQACEDFYKELRRVKTEKSEI